MPDRPIAEVLLRALADEGTGVRSTEVVLNAIQSYLAADTVRLVRPIEGEWATILRAGRDQLAPASLLADAADLDGLQRAGGWMVIPLRQSGLRGQLLAVEGARVSPELAWRPLADALVAALRVAQIHDQLRFQLRIRSLARQLPGEPTQAYRELEQSAARLFDAESALIVFQDETGELLRPHAEMGEPDRLGIPHSALPTGTATTLFRHDTGLREELSETSTELGITIAAWLAQSLISPDPKHRALLLVINPLSQDGDQLTAQMVQLSDAIQLDHDFAFPATRDDHRLIGSSPVIRKLSDQIMRVAATDLVLLVLGENGTGKELVSRKIHDLSARRHRPFLAINCAALTETLLESELFGHEQGAFTDAHESRPGKFEQASGGTLFLDEVGELSLSAQTKLLRVLEEQVIVRVGGSQTIQTDARIIAATNRPLAAMVRNGQFREDLFYRLNVVMLQVPPLRDRGEDVLTIAQSMLAEFTQKTGRRRPATLTREAEQMLLQWPWPGNVRELRNLMERLAYLATGATIDGPMVEAELQAGTTEVAQRSPSLTDATRQFQVDHIHQTIQAAGGNVTEAAKRLGLHRSNLYRKMRQLGMQDPPEE